MDYKNTMNVINSEYGDKTSRMTVIVEGIIQLFPRECEESWANAVAEDMKKQYPWKVEVHKKFV